MVQRHNEDEPEDLGDLHIVDQEHELDLGGKLSGPQAFETIAHLPDNKKLLQSIRDLSENTLTSAVGEAVTPMVYGLPSYVIAAWNRHQLINPSHDSPNDTDIDIVLNEERASDLPIPAFGLRVWAGIDQMDDEPTTLSIAVEDPSSGVGIAITKSEEGEDFELATQYGRTLGTLSTQAVAEMLRSFIRLDLPPIKPKELNDDTLRDLINLFGLTHGHSTSRYRVIGDVSAEEAEHNGQATGAVLLVERQTSYSSEIFFSAERILQYADLGSKVIHHLEAHFASIEEALKDPDHKISTAKVTVNRTVSSPAEYDPRTIKIQGLPPDPQKTEFRPLEIMSDTIQDVISSATVAKEKRALAKAKHDQPYPDGV